ncbi:hypothetical protein AAHE18_13G270900 [Arachis hypogaea]
MASMRCMMMLAFFIAIYLSMMEIGMAARQLQETTAPPIMNPSYPFPFSFPPFFPNFPPQVSLPPLPSSFPNFPGIPFFMPPPPWASTSSTSAP